MNTLIVEWQPHGRMCMDGTIHYYRGWIDKPNNLEMLDKFFGLTP